MNRPVFKMRSEVYREILYTIGAYPAETGGILLGPIGSNDVTDFFFDNSARCSRATYSPDHVTLSRKLKEEWMPSGIDFKGFVHSHPRTFDRLSFGDMVYIRRLLEINPDMDMFVAPIILPHEYSMRPLVVLKETPSLQRDAELVLF